MKETVYCVLSSLGANDVTSTQVGLTILVLFILMVVAIIVLLSQLNGIKNAITSLQGQIYLLRQDIQDSSKK